MSSRPHSFDFRPLASRSDLLGVRPRLFLPSSHRTRSSSSILRYYRDSYQASQFNVSSPHIRWCRLQLSSVELRAFDEGAFDIPPLENFDDIEETEAYVVSSSDGEDSDAEIVLSPLTDVDLPAVSVSTKEALTVTTHRLAMIAQGRKKHRIRHGVFINTGLVFFLTVLLLFVDWTAWRIVRLPLSEFHLTWPFFASAFLASSAGYIFVPLFKRWKIYQTMRRERSVRHPLKRRTPTMGGLFFVPVGIAVAEFLNGFSSPEVSGAAVATLFFATIGLLEDILTVLKNQSGGLSARIRILLEVAVGACFSFWLDGADISSPYGIKMLVPLPAPLGLLCLGKLYLFLTSFSFVAMGNGVNLTDGLDGLAGGTAALAFVGMSIAVLPLSPELAIFGASMAGACVGFLLHNRYKASVFMGDTGSLALGGALAAMAACSGMFLPLFISSGVFVLEASPVIIQVLYFRTTKRLLGAGRQFFRMAPFHHHLELCGVKEPTIVAGACLISSMLCLLAGYVGLISA